MRKPGHDGWKERIFEVQQAYWKGSAVIGYEKQQKINTELAEILSNIREQGRNKIQGSRDISKQFVIGLYSQSTVRELMKKFVESSRHVSMLCTCEMTKFVTGIMGESVKILREPPPCHFEVIAIGSLARGEATPYSDLEYIILVDRVESDIKEYFTKLSMTSYFLIGNLGETNLKYMAIKELDGWFQDMAKNGFKIDGLSPQAGNIPTGNGTSDRGYSFITTPDDLFKAYEYVSHHPDEDSLRGDLTAMMCFMTVLYSHGHKEGPLLQSLRLKVQAMELSEQRIHVNKEMLESDMRKFDFAPDQRLVDQAYTVDAKRQLYRFPSILLFDLAVTNGIFEADAWGTAGQLLATKTISEDFHLCLMFQLAVACYVRLSAYLYHDSQDDRISLASQRVRVNCQEKDPSLNSPGDRWYVHTGLVLALADTMIPMKTALGSPDVDTARVCKHYSTESTSSSQAMCRIATLQHTGHTTLAFEMLVKRFGQLDLLLKPKGVHEWINSHPEFADQRNIEILANILLESLRFNEALPLLFYLSEISTGCDKETIALSIAECQRGLGDHEQALLTLRGLKGSDSGNHFLRLGNILLDLRQLSNAENSLLMALQYYYKDACNGPKVFDYFGFQIPLSPPCSQALVTDLSKLSPGDRLNLLQHPTTGLLNCIESIAKLYQEMYEGSLGTEYYKLANEYHNKYQCMFEQLYGDDSLVPAAAHGYFVLGKACHNRDHYEEAQAFYSRSLRLFGQIYGEGRDRPSLALLHREMGRNYIMLDMNTTAKQHLCLALDMYKRLYGKASNRQIDMLDVHSIMADCLCELNENSKALEHYMLEYNMRKCFHGEDSDHPDLVVGLNNIGFTYLRMKEFTKAKEPLMLALNMDRRIHGEHGDGDHTGISSVILHNLGNYYRNMKQYTKAEEHYKLSIDMYRRIRLEEDDLDIARVLNRLGHNYNEMKDYKKAEEHFWLSIEMYRRLLGVDSDHPDIADLLCCIGKTQVALRLLEKAGMNFKESLEMYTRLHDDNSQHPDLLEVKQCVEKYCQLSDLP